MKKLIMKFVNVVFGRSNTSPMPRFAVLLCDVFIVLFSLFIVGFLMYYRNHANVTVAYMIKNSVAIILIYILAFLVSGSYKGLVRYSGFQDIYLISKVNLMVIVALILCKIIINNTHALSFIAPFFASYSFTILACAIILIFMVLMRLIVRRIYNEYLRPKPTVTNAMIYGAGDAGTLTLNALYQDGTNAYNIICFVDDSHSKVGKSVNGILITSPEQAFNQKFIKKHKIETVILAMPSVDVEKRNEIINKIIDKGLQVKTVPHFASMVDNKFEAKQIENIKIEDLLGRDPIILGKENVTQEIENKVVLVTGAAGSIGSEICRQVFQYNPRHLVMLDQAESPMYDLQFEFNSDDRFKHIAVPKDFIIGNVKDHDKMEELFKKFKPDIVYHAAAYKHVPLMEEFPYEAVFVNVLGTKNIADLSIKYGVKKFVMISTDKAVNPTNVMGATKRIAEIYTQSRNSATKFVTTRFGNVLGSNGSVIPLFKKQLAKGGPLTVTDRNIIRYFMTIPEACSLVLEAGSIGEDDDVFVFDMGEPVKIYDLAEKMIKLSNMNDVKIEITGLRPGEKLYEELLATKENTIKTDNPKIMRAKVRKYTEEEVDADIATLSEILPTCNDFKIVGQMKKIVPEFKSNNSIYQVLDAVLDDDKGDKKDVLGGVID